MCTDIVRPLLISAQTMGERGGGRMKRSGAEAAGDEDQAEHQRAGRESHEREDRYRDQRTHDERHAWAPAICDVTESELRD
jgi:hypothetical protein